MLGKAKQPEPPSPRVGEGPRSVKPREQSSATIGNPSTGVLG
jgi:hypothetical protein